MADLNCDAESELRFLLGYTHMNDQQIIASAYEARLEQVYLTFHGECIVAHDQNAKQQAERRFTDGVTLARQIRDRALAILP